MRPEILEKINNLIRKPTMNESEVLHLMTLARKLVEGLPEPERKSYALLKFFCDWTLHPEIHRSKAGTQLIGQAHSVVINHMKKSDNSTFSRDLTSALSLDRVRDEYNALLRSINRSGEISIDKIKWGTITPIILEIISNCPVKAPNDSSEIATSIQTLRAHPIKGNSVVEEIRVIKVPSSTFRRDAPRDEMTYCWELVTSDTTRFITPIVKLS